MWRGVCSINSRHDAGVRTETAWFRLTLALLLALTTAHRLLPTKFHSSSGGGKAPLLIGSHCSRLMMCLADAYY